MKKKKVTRYIIYLVTLWLLEEVILAGLTETRDYELPKGEFIPKLKGPFFAAEWTQSILCHVDEFSDSVSDVFWHQRCSVKHKFFVHRDSYKEKEGDHHVLVNPPPGLHRSLITH